MLKRRIEKLENKDNSGLRTVAALTPEEMEVYNKTGTFPKHLKGKLADNAAVVPATGGIEDWEHLAAHEQRELANDLSHLMKEISADASS